MIYFNLSMPRSAVASCAGALMIAILSGCSTPQQGESQAEIVVSLPVLHHLVAPLVPDRDVPILLPPDTSPHAYSPRPSAIRLISQAEVVFYAHPDVDGWVSELGGSQNVPLSRSEMAPDDAGDDHEHGDSHQEEDDHDHEEATTDEHGHHHDEDAHWWSDPSEALYAIRKAADVLCSHFPDECAPIRRRAAIAATQLDSISSALRDSIQAASESGQTPCVITAQPFMDRFLDAFDIAYVGPLSISAEVEPSPRSLARIGASARDLGCSTLIVQSIINNSSLQTLADDQGWSIRGVDPLGSSEDSYEAYLEHLANVILSPAS